MASNLYNSGVLRLFNGTINYLSSTIKALVVNTGYTFNKGHNFVSDINGEVSGTGYSRLALTGKSISLNSNANTVTFDCDDLVYTGVTTSTAWDAVITFQDSGLDSTSPLLGYLEIDTLSANGVNIRIVVDEDGIIQVTNNIQ